MTRKTQPAIDRHLTEGELFTLALPPVGEPEALPRHLLECLACSHALSEWKVAVADLAERDIDAISQRGPRQWEALERQTLEAIGHSRVRSPGIPWRWAATVAAVLLFVAVALPLRKTQRSLTLAARKVTPAVELSVADQADDALLRDVARLSRGEEESNDTWLSLAPDPDRAAPGMGGRS